MPIRAKRLRIFWFNGQMEKKVHFVLTWIENFSIFPVKQKVEKINSRLLFILSFSYFLFHFFSATSWRSLRAYLINPNLQFCSGKNKFCLKVFCPLPSGMRKVRLDLPEETVVWAVFRKYDWFISAEDHLLHPQWDHVIFCLWHTLGIVHSPGCSCRQLAWEQDSSFWLLEFPMRSLVLETSHNGKNQTRCQTRHQGIF